jgi:hypothetical protein
MGSAAQIDWEALSFKPDGRIGSQPPMQYDWAFLYTRHLEKIADKCWSYNLGGFVFLTGFGWTKKEFEDAVMWAGVQDDIAEREDSMDHVWEVEKSLKRVNTVGA